MEERKQSPIRQKRLTDNHLMDVCYLGSLINGIVIPFIYLFNKRLCLFSLKYDVSTRMLPPQATDEKDSKGWKLIKMCGMIDSSTNPKVLSLKQIYGNKIHIEKILYIKLNRKNFSFDN